MTVKRVNFDNVANGAALSGAAGGTSDAISGVVVGSGATAVRDGATGVITSPSGASTYIWDTVATKTLGVNATVDLDAVASSTSTDPYLIWFGIGTSRLISAHLTANNQLRLSSSAVSNLWTQTGSFPLDATRIKLFANPGTTTANGQAELAFYDASGNKIGGSGLLTGLNLGTANITQWRVGKAGTTSYATPIRLSEVRADDAATGLVADTVAPPTVSAGTDQLREPFDTVTLSGTTVAGTVATWGWSQIAGDAVSLSGTGSSRTFTAPAALSTKTYTFRVSGTNAGGTGTDDMVVTVPPHLEWMKKSGALTPMRNMTP